MTPEEQALRNSLQDQTTSSTPTRNQSSSNQYREREVGGQNYRPREQGNAGYREGFRFNSSQVRQNSERGKGHLRKPRNVSGLFRFTTPPGLPEAPIQRSASLEQRDGQLGGERSSFKRTLQMPEWNYSSRTERDKQLDHHITQTRTRPEHEWDCLKCGFNNSGANRYCGDCGDVRSTTATRDAPSDGLRGAENWKHLRRRSDASLNRKERNAPSARVETVGDPEVEARLRRDDQARMIRLETTRDGRFVGLRNGQVPPKANLASSGQTRMEQRLPPEPRTPPFQSAQSKSKDGWTIWSPSATDKFDTNQPIELEEETRSRPTIKTFEGWDYPTDDIAAAGAESVSEGSVQALTADQSAKCPSRIRRNLSFDSDFIGDDMPSRPQGIRKPERRMRSSGIETTSIAQGVNRHKERKGKNVVSEVDFDEDDEDALRAKKKQQRKQKIEKNNALHRATAAPTPIHLPEFISVSNLAGVLRVRVEDFADKMKELGFPETNNDHVFDAETAGLIAAEFNYEPIIDRREERDLLPLAPAVDKSVLPARPPVVTIMGHVDHGKTTLLDYLRKSSVAASEHGGITQHIGAFSVPMPGGRVVTFLDTPGHEAFLSMRQRGANVTDIVILVVAADDSVKPQTIEAIKHAQVAKVPMIVAINKIDKEDSNVEKVKQDLARYGVEIEDYGGDTQVVCVSGKTGQGMEELEDAAVALADILDMRSKTDGQAEGWVLEATTKKAGRVATVLVRRGTLRPSDVIVAGTSWARVRSLRNEAGAIVSSAGPGTPVEIDGWREQPSAGDEVIQAPDEQKAKSVIAYRLEATDRTKMAADMEAVNETRRLEQEKRDQLEKATNLAETKPSSTTPTKQDASPPPTTTTPSTPQTAFFIIKADVSGSLEAITTSISTLTTPEIHPHVLRSGVGPVTEFDIDHAAVAHGTIISFNTPITSTITHLAETKGVHIIDQSIIYRLIDDVRAKLGERLPQRVTQRVVGEAEVAQRFEINTRGRVTVPVAGCRVRNGVVGRVGKVRVVRGGGGGF